MTVLRLPDSRLLLHSPIGPSPALLSAVKELGTVAFLVAPNRLHHLFIDQWQKEYPDAATFVAPGLETKRADLAITGVLSDDPEPGWEGALDQVLLRGMPYVNEVVFFHRASATLIVTDLAFNLGPNSPLLTRAAFRFGGGYGQLGPTLLERLLVRNRAAFRESLERILEWPFDRVIVAHGNVCETGGRAQLMRGYSWALD